MPYLLYLLFLPEELRKHGLHILGRLGQGRAQSDHGVQDVLLKCPGLEEAQAFTTEVVPHIEMVRQDFDRRRIVAARLEALGDRPDGLGK